ncbi:dihydrodipicolinate synthase family protein [Fusobacterium ulcerans]|uniref:dihydrodipicolinate synthase family protein n=1 Tax=Fusobacterium ulcerans TaxID=861 RepID=UPI0026F0292E|nr:dihydrodipicolinate synthase family protein [Fusobacterium ulcerans]
MDLNLLKGIYVPILTPMDENENVDIEKLRKQVNFVIDGGVSGILAHGSNSEFYMFDDEDYELIVKTIIEEVKGRVPVIMGIGAIRTSKCVKLTQLGKRIGVDGVALLQPMFLKPTEEELYLHYKTVAESIEELPLLIYNNPRIGYTLSADLVEKLARNVKNIVGIKDSSGDINQLLEFIRRTRDIEFKIFGGKDTLLFSSLTVGAVGGVCTAANIFPELVTSIYNKYKEGDLKESLELQFKLNPVRLSMDKASFPVATKDMANINKMNVGEPIKPSLPSNKTVVDFMAEKMAEAGQIKR